MGDGVAGAIPVLAQRAVEDSPRWTRAVEDQSAPIPEEVTSKLGGNIIETWSLDASREGQSAAPFKRGLTG